MPPAPRSRSSAPPATPWRPSSRPSPMPACAYICPRLLSLIEIPPPRIGFPPLRIISLPPPTPSSPVTRLSIPLQFSSWILSNLSSALAKETEFWRRLSLGVCFCYQLQSKLEEMSSAISDMYYGTHADPMYQTNRTPHQFYDSHIGRPMLPDVQFRVPMESRRDVDKVKDALDVDGVQGVNCDLASQTVTVTGNVPYHRLLKKLKHVKRKSRLIGFIPDNQAYSPSYVNPYSSYHGSSSYHGRMPMSRPLSPPHLRSTSYVAHPMERMYYEDYEDYRPSRYSDF